MEGLLSFLREAIVQRPRGPLVVARLGGGPAPEITIALERWPEVAPRLDVTFIEVDGFLRGPHPELVQLAMRTGARIRSVAVPSQLSSPSKLADLLGKPALIFSRGIPRFRDQDCRRLLASLWEALAPHGQLVFGDAAGGPVDGPGFERTLGDLAAFASSLRPEPSSIEQCSGLFGARFLSIRL